MSRYASFRFTARADPALDSIFTRHAGAARFAYNQALRTVCDAIDARRIDSTTKIPWSGFDLINAFNGWKHSHAAGRTWSVDGDGVATLADSGLAWRREVCAQVFEEAVVDLGRALDAYWKSRKGSREGRKVGFPRFKRKGYCRESFRLRNKFTRNRAAVRVGEQGRMRSITLPTIGTVDVAEDTRPLRRLLRAGPDGAQRARIWFVIEQAQGALENCRQR